MPAPVVDGVELPLEPTKAIESGRVLTNITIMLGSNADEGTEFIATTRNMTINALANMSAPQFDTWLSHNFLAQVFGGNRTAMDQLHLLRGICIPVHIISLSGA